MFYHPGEREIRIRHDGHPVARPQLFVRPSFSVGKPEFVGGKTYTREHDRFNVGRKSGPDCPNLVAGRGEVGAFRPYPAAPRFTGQRCRLATSKAQFRSRIAREAGRVGSGILER